MAFVDYGSVVKKNGKIIQTDFFMDMKEAVGFVLDEVDYEYPETTWDDEKFNFIETGNIVKTKKKVNDEYFSYIGDRDFLICIYKGSLTIISNNNVIKIINDISYYDPKMKESYIVNGVKLNIKRTAPGCRRYRLTFEYKGDKYDCFYGYGVDVNKKAWYYSSKREKNKIMRWFNA